MQFLCIPVELLFINNYLDPYSKKPILGLRIESKLKIAGMRAEHLFSLEPCIKRKQMFGWHPCDSEIGFNPQAQDWFFEFGSKSFKFQK